MTDRDYFFELLSKGDLADNQEAQIELLALHKAVEEEDKRDLMERRKLRMREIAQAKLALQSLIEASGQAKAAKEEMARRSLDQLHQKIKLRKSTKKQLIPWWEADCEPSIEIQEQHLDRAKTIRDGWTDEEREERAVAGTRPVAWEIPCVHLEEDPDVDPYSEDDWWHERLKQIPFFERKCRKYPWYFPYLKKAKSI